MKKSTGNLLAVAVCLILAGVAVFCLMMSSYKWDFSLLGRGSLKEAIYEVDGDFSGVAIFSDTEKIEFRPSDDGRCRVVCLERDKAKHAVSVKDGTLTIETDDSRKWYEKISFFSFGSTAITVCLPQSEYASLSIDGSTGSVTLPEVFSFGSADIRLSTGDVDCRACVSDELRVATSTGDIRAEGLSAGAIDMTVTTGRVDIQSVSCRGDINLAVTTGGAFLSDVTCENLLSGGSTGGVTLKNVVAADSISVSRSTGNVRFDKCDAAELTVETSTGRVSGSLLSDKVFIARSGTGRVTVPESITGGRCAITTTTGSIDITIENE